MFVNKCYHKILQENVQEKCRILNIVFPNSKHMAKHRTTGRGIENNNNNYDDDDDERRRKRTVLRVMPSILSGILYIIGRHQNL